MTSSIQEAREALGQRLRELRRAAGMSGRQLAELAGWHESKISKLEYGRRPPSEADIRAYCEYTGADDQLPDLLATLRHIDGTYVEYRRSLGTGTKLRQQALVKLYEKTHLLRTYQPFIIPGILQTSEYAEAILRQAIDFYRIPDDLDEGVSKRMERQQVLYRGDHRFHIVIAEQALSTDVATDDVMIGQLDRLLAVMGLPRVLFGIVPANVYCPAPAMNFIMFDDRMVLVEAITAELIITQPREIAIYKRTFDMLAKQAVTGETARRIIRTALEDRSRSAQG